MYKVSSKHPIPNNRRPQNSYPWREMEVGDSFFVPASDLTHGASTFHLSPNLTKSGFKIARRTVEEKGIKGVRVWRVA